MKQHLMFTTIYSYNYLSATIYSNKMTLTCRLPKITIFVV